MRTKTIKFDDVKEQELFEYLQTLPHGEFSQKTKKFWLHEMAEAERKKFQGTPEQHNENMKRYTR